MNLCSVRWHPISPRVCRPRQPLDVFVVYVRLFLVSGTSWRRTNVISDGTDEICTCEFVWSIACEKTTDTEMEIFWQTSYSFMSFISHPPSGGRNGSVTITIETSTNITTNQPDTKSNPNTSLNPNPTIKQHAIVNIQLSYVSREIHTRQCCCTVCTNFDCVTLPIYCNCVAFQFNS